MLSASSRQAAKVVADDSGAVLVFFAIFASTAVLIAAFVLNLGNWFEHQRHLQLQADAAAFAAAQDFQYPCTEATTKAIYKSAGQYAGAESITTPTGATETSSSPLYNEQIGKTAQKNIHAEVNKKKYAGQSAGDTTTVEQAPCEPEAGMIDIKLTETDLPWIMRALKVPFINAHARVSILQETSAERVQPLAVAQTVPVAAKAYFVNEDSSNAVIAESKLSLASNGREWTSEKTAAVPMKKTKNNEAHIGVVIALSGNAPAPKSGGTIATKCAEAYVQCFDTSSGGPLLHIAGYTMAETGTVEKPISRRVRLSQTPGTCSGAYFSDAASNCKLTIEAQLDYGGTRESGVSTNKNGMTVTAKAGTGASGSLAYNSGKKAWVGEIELLSGSGSNEIQLTIKCTKEATSPCPAKNQEGKVLNAHRAYAASAARSGIILAAKVFEPGSSEAPVPKTEGANSYEVCETVGAEKHEGAACEPQLKVSIETEGTLADAASCGSESACKAEKAGFYDAVHHLKFEGNGGVLYECIPGENAGTSEYRAHLKEGCNFSYKLNEQKEGTFSDPTCTAKNPYDCITVGGKGNHNGARSAVAERFESAPPAGTKAYCHNSWQNLNKGKVPVIPADDARITQVFVIPYGSINSEGEPTGGLKAVPIEGFASFYVTGFDGDKCTLTTEEKATFVADDPAPGFEIVGHFIKYVDGVGQSSGAKCKTEATAIETCIATLTE